MSSTQLNVSAMPTFLAAASEKAADVDSLSDGLPTTTAFPVFIPSETFVSNRVAYIFELVVDLIISFIVANVGIVSNVFVIVVFCKQGFNKSVNISMTTIALWDLVKCLAGSAERLSGPLSLVSPATAVSWSNLSTPSLVYLITFTNYVSSSLAAYVALERCLCIAIPFSVSTLLTPKVTMGVMISLSVIVFGCFVVIFGIYDIVWMYNPVFNETIFIYRHSQFYKIHHAVLMQYYNLVGIICPTVSFFVILTCTCVIVIKLREASQFRQGESKDQSRSTKLSSRDKQVIRMLLCIIVVYVISLFPRVVLYFAKYFIYEFYFLREYHNLFVVICYWIFLLDFFNAAVNFFVFASMSSGFRNTLYEILGLNSKDVKEISSGNER